jgi:hypothetical protein
LLDIAVLVSDGGHLSHLLLGHRNWHVNDLFDLHVMLTMLSGDLRNVNVNLIL